MYERELAKVRARRREKNENKIGVVTVRSKGPVPPVDYEGNVRWIMSEMVQEESTKIGQKLRRHIRSKWNAEKTGDCIVVVNTRWHPDKDYITYTVEMTAYGALTHKRWLAEAIKEFGFDVKIIKRGQYEEIIGVPDFSWVATRRKKRFNPVTQCDLQGNPIFTFFSAKEAAKEIGGGDSNIILACRTGAVRYGYKWIYAKELGRHFLGSEVNPDFVQMAENRVVDLFSGK